MTQRTRAVSTLAALALTFTLAPSVPVAQATTQPANPAPTLPQAQLVEELKQIGADVKTEGNAPDGAVTSIIFPYTHTPRRSPGGTTVPPYPVTDDLVHQIAQLPKVTALEFNMSPRLTEAAIKDIGGMKQLEHLSLNAMPLTDVSMADLAGLTNLNYLRVSGAGGITVAGWATLENFKQLETLWVAETKLGDQGIQHFKPLTKLKDITLYGTPVTDAGAEVLLGLPNLVSVRCGPHMTPAEVAKLKAALPNCRFWR
jgi:hypothetical protein